MSRISIGNAGKYGSGGSNDFFTLADDGDRAVVTFLYDDPDGEDIDYFVVHEVQIDGKRRYVNCNAIGDDGERIHEDNCPLCANGYPRIEKLFLQLYNHDTGKVETWDRGRSYVAKIVTYVNKFGRLVTQPFEIVRSGRKGDTNTTYEFLPEPSEPNAVLDDYDPKSELLGTLIVKAETDDMWDMIDGRFTLQDNSQQNSQRRGAAPSRRTAQTRESAPRQSAPTRQPASRRSAPSQPSGEQPPASRPVRRGPARGGQQSRF